MRRKLFHLHSFLFIKQFYKNSEPHFCSKLRTIKNNEPQIWERKKKKKGKGKSEQTEWKKENERLQLRRVQLFLKQRECYCWYILFFFLVFSLKMLSNLEQIKNNWASILEKNWEQSSLILKSMVIIKKKECMSSPISSHK